MATHYGVTETAHRSSHRHHRRPGGPPCSTIPPSSNCTPRPASANCASSPATAHHGSPAHSGRHARSPSRAAARPLPRRLAALVPTPDPAALRGRHSRAGSPFDGNVCSHPPSRQPSRLPSGAGAVGISPSAGHDSLCSELRSLATVLATMMSCIRCQVSTDDGYQRVNSGLCPSCAHALSTAMLIARKSHQDDAHLTLELAVDR